MDRMEFIMRVLIVDDSKILQRLLKRSLMETNKNMRIHQAFNCKEAMELFLSSRPTKVILDIDLPDGSGIDLLRKFREADPRVQVIMFTNYPTDEFRKFCMDLGASHFIDKSNLKGLIAQFT